MSAFAFERLLLRTKVRILRNRLTSMRRGPLIATLVVTAFLALFWVAGCLALYLGLRYLDGIAELGPILTTRLFHLFFLTLLFLLGFSNVLIGLGTLFRSPEVAFLAPKPIPARSLFAARVIESVLDASWPFLFLAVPVLTAFGIVRGAGPLYYVACAALLPVYVAIAGTLGCSVALLIGIVFPRIRAWQVGSVLASCAAVAGWSLWTRYDVRELTRGGDLTTILERFSGSLSGVQSPWLPSSWIGRGILRSAEGDLGEGGYALLLLLANAALIALVLDAVAHRLYLPAWAAVAISGGRGGPRAAPASAPMDPAGPARELPPANAIRSARAAAWALARKDVRVFFRDPVQWGQLLLLGLMLGIYLVSLIRMPLRFPSPFWFEVTVLLNRSTAALMAAIITSRFVFPLLSLEGRHRWILETSPIDRGELLRQKFLAGLVPTGAVGVTLILLAEINLGVGALEILLDVVVMLAMAVALTALACAFGAVWPNYREDNPARLVNSVGGTLNFFVSLLLIVGMIILDAFPLALRTAVGSESGEVTMAIAGRTAIVVIASAIVTAIALRRGRRSLEAQEF